MTYLAREPDPSGDADSRFTRALVLDVLGVLAEHGYRESVDSPSLDVTVENLRRLVLMYEGGASA